jgi:hypothetical protein
MVFSQQKLAIHHARRRSLLYHNLVWFSGIRELLAFLELSFRGLFSILSEFLCLLHDPRRILS